MGRSEYTLALPAEVYEVDSSGELPSSRPASGRSAWTRLARPSRPAPGDAVASRAVADTVVGGTFLIEIRGTDGQRWLARDQHGKIWESCLEKLGELCAA